MSTKETEVCFFPRPTILGSIPRNRSAVIEAHAGTGKTFTIEHLVVDLILQPEPRLSIENILVVTFTDKAAEELKARVRALMETILATAEPVPPENKPFWRIGDEERQALRQAMFSFDLAPISTIHSFCNRLLKENAFWGGRLFSLELADGFSLFSRAFRTCLRRMLAHPEREDELTRIFEEWMEEATLTDLESFLFDAHKAAGSEVRAEHIPENRVLTTFLPPVRQELEAIKRAEGLADFDDLLQLVAENLHEPREGNAFLDSLRERYRVALIDEFQDTDATQWSIFRRLFIESEQGNVCYLIGDPKQSIYAFRGADVQTYLRAAQFVAQKDGLIKLTHNYRSTNDIIEAYNIILDHKACFFTSDQAETRIDYSEPVLCGRPDFFACDGQEDSVKPVTLFHAVPEPNKTWKAEELRNEIAQAIVREIKALLYEDNRRVFIGQRTPEGTTKKPLRAKDIFVLTRTGKESVEMQEALRKEGIPCSLYKQEGLFKSDEARDICTVLSAIAHPEDESRRMSAWLTPFFGYSLAELLNLRISEASHAGTILLSRWKELEEARKPAEMLQSMIEDSGIIRRELFFSESERSLTNYLHLVELLQEEALRKPTTVEDLIAFLTERSAGISGERDQDIQRLESDKDTVQIMTIHKSKGLEAAVVFLYGGLSNGNISKLQIDKVTENGEPKLVIGGKPEHLKKLVEQAQREENQRLLYVALTRAKAKLYLPYVSQHVDEKTGKQKWDYPYLGGIYLILNQRLHTLATRETARIQHLFECRDISQERSLLQPSAQKTGIAEGNSQTLASVWQEVHVPSLPRPNMRALHKKAESFVVTSYSALKAKSAYVQAREEEDDTYLPGLEEALHARALPSAEESEQDLPAGAAFGVCIHALLEETNFTQIQECETIDQWRALPETEALFDRGVKRFGLANHHVDYAQNLVYHAFRAPIRTREQDNLPKAVVSAEALIREQEFLFPYPEASHPTLNEVFGKDVFIEKGFIKGFIDVIFEFDGKVYFADWKTDLLENYHEAYLRQVANERYLLQSKLYSLALIKILKIRSAEEYDRTFGGRFYCFLRGMIRSSETSVQGIDYLRHSWEDVLEFEQWLQNYPITGGSPKWR